MTGQTAKLTSPAASSAQALASSPLDATGLRWPPVQRRGWHVTEIGGKESTSFVGVRRGLPKARQELKKWEKVCREERKWERSGTAGQESGLAPGSRRPSNKKRASSGRCQPDETQVSLYGIAEIKAAERDCQENFATFSGLQTSNQFWPPAASRIVAESRPPLPTAQADLPRQSPFPGDKRRCGDAAGEGQQAK
jgi:hypothetical protein